MSIVWGLDRVYAFTVSPQKRVEEGARTLPRGGAVKLEKGLQETIAKAFKKLDPADMTTVEFEKFSSGRSHPVRDALKQIAFGATTAPKAAAQRLAARLSGCIDDRSHDSLAVVIVEASDDRRRVTFLVLPREEVIQLKSQKASAGEEQLLKAVSDAFGAASHMRKVARVEGVDNQSAFIEVTIFDYQMNQADRSAATFWVAQFLEARYQMDAATGTKLLSQALRRAVDAAPVDKRDAVFAALHKAASGEVPQTSLELYAQTEVPKALHDAYFKGVAPHLHKAKFDVNATIVKKNVGRRIVVTDDGIVISAPMDAVSSTRLKVTTADNGARVVELRATSVKSEGVGKERKRSQSKASAANVSAGKSKQ